MDKEIKAKWLDALRSGKYKQTKDVLKNRGGAYCCLGVLCVVMGVKPVWSRNSGGYKFDGDQETLTPGLKTLVGLHSRAVRHLVQMNDDAGKSFEQIADYIEANY